MKEEGITKETTKSIANYELSRISCYYYNNSTSKNFHFDSPDDDIDTNNNANYDTEFDISDDENAQDATQMGFVIINHNRGDIDIKNWSLRLCHILNSWIELGKGLSKSSKLIDSCR
ncbi:hypothetical protein K501DRAFT_273551 [Backusella circina FSU 941]|nr:hypothetical protein K501DRAFT_273551 [Backusella circina FSU 941]